MILFQLLAALLGLLLGGHPAPPPPPPPPPPVPAADQADSVEAYDRDVYVIVGSTLRNPTESTAPDAPLFNVAGVNLGITWGGWTAATATSTARTIGGPSPRTEVDQHYTHLVPGGVYSVFWGTLLPDSENPACPGVERTLPMTSADPNQQPDAASFVAGADGTATFRGNADGDLLAAGQAYFALVYHFDGRTWDSLPNHGEYTTQGPNCRSSFGEDAMRQLLVLQKW